MKRGLGELEFFSLEQKYLRIDISVPKQTSSRRWSWALLSCEDPGAKSQWTKTAWDARWAYKENLFPMRAAGHQHRRTREVVESLFLQVFQNKIQNNLIRSPGRPRSEQEAQLQPDWRSSEDPVDLNYLVWLVCDFANNTLRLLPVVTKQLLGKFLPLPQYMLNDAYYPLF